MRELTGAYAHSTLAILRVPDRLGRCFADLQTVAGPAGDHAVAGNVLKRNLLPLPRVPARGVQPADKGAIASVRDDVLQPLGTTLSHEQPIRRPARSHGAVGPEPLRVDLARSRALVMPRDHDGAGGRHDPPGAGLTPGGTTHPRCVGRPSFRYFTEEGEPLRVQIEVSRSRARPLLRPHDRDAVPSSARKRGLRLQGGQAGRAL